MNKPIAYVTGAGQFAPVSVDTVLKVGTPLYTHPAELTDDDKEKIAKKLWLFGWVESTKQGFRLLDEIAILRKASER